MSDMLKGFVATELDNQIRKKYPHMQYPSIVCATVVSSTVSDGQVMCTLKILDKNGDQDNAFPEIPFVQTSIDIKINDVVVIAMLYGVCVPYIIGRYL